MKSIRSHGNWTHFLKYPRQIEYFIWVSCVTPSPEMPKRPTVYSRFLRTMVENDIERGKRMCLGEDDHSMKLADCFYRITYKSLYRITEITSFRES